MQRYRHCRQNGTGSGRRNRLRLPEAEQGSGPVIWTTNGILCTCAGRVGLKSVYHCQPTQLAEEAFLGRRRLLDN